ncbi:hypothetical protein SCARD494_10747 [Seiridium cardinale]
MPLLDIGSTIRIHSNTTRHQLAPSQSTHHKPQERQNARSGITTINPPENKIGGFFSMDSTEEAVPQGLHRFPRLPCELRLMIWKEHFFSLNRFIPYDMAGERVLPVKHMATPSINQESQAVFKHHYTICLSVKTNPYPLLGPFLDWCEATAALLYGHNLENANSGHDALEGEINTSYFNVFERDEEGVMRLGGCNTAETEEDNNKESDEGNGGNDNNKNNDEEEGDDIDNNDDDEEDHYVGDETDDGHDSFTN